MIEYNDFLVYYGHRELFPLMEKADVKKRIFYVLGIGNEQVLNSMLALDINNGTDIINKEGAPTFYHALHNRDTWTVFANCFSLSYWLRVNLKCQTWTVQGGVDHEIFKRSGKPVAYKIVGSGSKRQAEGTIELLKAIKLIQKQDKRCTSHLYAGRGYSQGELANVLSSADVYLDAQKWGGWNNAVAEAMAIGVPTVCTNIMGNMDFCKHEENCLIVNVDDIDAMVKAVIRLLTDASLRKQIMINAESTMQEYTWEHSAIQMGNALVSL
jgi:hypothetical protein